MMSRDPDEPGDAALRAACAAEGFAPRPVLRTDDYDVMFGFVAAGVGVALVPQMALVEREGVVVRPLAGVQLRRSIRFVSFARTRHRPLLRCSLRCVLGSTRPAR